MKQVLDRAKQLHIQAGRPAVEVHVFFDDKLIWKKSVELISSELASSVHELMSTGMFISVACYDESCDRLPPFGVYRLSVRRLADGDRQFWVTTSANFLPKCSPERISQLIAKKQRRLEDYGKHYSENWLLIVADASAFSSTWDFQDLDGQQFDCGFDRVFLMQNTFQRFVRQLK